MAQRRVHASRPHDRIARAAALALLLAATARAAEPAPCDCAPPAAAPVPGVEVLLEQRLDLLRGKRVGLVTNPTGVDRALRSDIDRLAHHPDLELVALFGPEHGVRGDAQAGEHVAASRDRATGLPVHSLYGEHRGRELLASGCSNAMGASCRRAAGFAMATLEAPGTVEQLITIEIALTPEAQATEVLACLGTGGGADSTS